VSDQPAEEKSRGRVLTRNPKARHDYHVIETLEAGLVLSGTEIKSVRDGRVNLKGAFGVIRGGEVFVEGMNISPYESGGYVNHVPERPRKLLLRRREILRLIGAVQQKGFTLVPLDVHLSGGYAKMTLALAKGKKSYDKREDLKRRTEERDMKRAIGRR